MSKKLKIILTKEPLEIVSFDISGELIRTTSGSQFLLIAVNRYSKLLCRVFLKRMTVPKVAKALIGQFDFD